MRGEGRAAGLRLLKGPQGVANVAVLPPLFLAELFLAGLRLRDCVATT